MRVIPRMKSIAVAITVAAVLPSAAVAQTLAAPIARVSLDDAIRLALARNQALHAQRLEVDASRADEITAALKPNPAVSVDVDGLTPFSPRQMTWDFLENSVSYGGSVSYLFERGGTRRNRVTAARAATDVTAKNVQEAERQLRFQTAQAFIDALLAKSSRDLARQNLESFSQIVEVNRQRVASGDLAEADFYKISLQKLQFEQDVSSAEVALVVAKASLRQLLGFEEVADNFEVVGDLAFTEHDVNLEALKQQALASRPDLLAAESGVTLAESTLTLEHSNRARDVEGNVDYTHTGPDNIFAVGAAIDLPVHDRNQGNIARSQVQVRQATESALAQRYLVVTDVVNAFASWQTSRKVVGLYRSGYLDQAQQSLDASRYVYQRGAGTLLDLLDAERTYRDIQLGYRQALAAYMSSVQQINFAVGKQVIP